MLDKFFDAIAAFFYLTWVRTRHSFAQSALRHCLREKLTSSLLLELSELSKLVNAADEPLRPFSGTWGGVSPEWCILLRDNKAYGNWRDTWDAGEPHPRFTGLCDTVCERVNILSRLQACRYHWLSSYYIERNEKNFSPSDQEDPLWDPKNDPTPPAIMGQIVQAQGEALHAIKRLEQYLKGVDVL